jgi:hypothetical protein
LARLSIRKAFQAQATFALGRRSGATWRGTSSAFLRTGNSGRFQLVDRDILVDATSRGIASLHDDFAAYVESELTQRCDEALTALKAANNDGVRRQVLARANALGPGRQFFLNDFFNLLDGADGWRDEIRSISDAIDSELSKAVNLLLNTNRSLLDEVVAALSTLWAEDDDALEDDGAEESSRPVSQSAHPKREALELLMSAIRNWSRAIAESRRSIGGRSGRVIALIGDRMPPTESLASLGDKIALRAQMRTFVQSPRTSVVGLATFYARFRRQAARQGQHFRPDEEAGNFFSRNLIS